MALQGSTSVTAIANRRSSSSSTAGSSRGIGIRTAADASERSHGQLHVYDGDGKGKSQAALGVVLRTIGLGICEQKRTRVLLLRFLKGPGRAYDEDAAIEALQQGFPQQRPTDRRRVAGPIAHHGTVGDSGKLHHHIEIVAV